MMRTGHFRHLFNITLNYEVKIKFPSPAHREFSVLLFMRAVLVVLLFLLTFCFEIVGVFFHG